MKLGQENILNPITQLQHFIYKCNGKFQLKKFKKNCISSIDYVRKLPDFLMVHKDGEVIFLEVKFRYDGCYDPENIFDIFPSTKVLVINKYHIDSNGCFTGDLFNIYDAEVGKGYIEIPLAEWLEKNFNSMLKRSSPNVGEANSSVIRKYEILVSKWILDTREKK